MFTVDYHCSVSWSADFGTNETALSFDVITKGDRQVEWFVKESIDWLSCSPETGKITNSSSSVVVTIDKKGLKDGVYKDVLVISSRDEKIADKTITVRMIVESSAMSVSTEKLFFNADETMLSFDVFLNSMIRTLISLFGL